MSDSLSPLEVLQTTFPGIQASIIEEMIASGQILEFPAGMVLCRESEPGTTFYIILQGDVKATKIINDVEQRLLTTLKPGDFFGEMALIHNAPRAATITTITPTKVLEITKGAFSSLLDRSSSISISIIRAVSRRLRENDQMAIDDLRVKAAELADAYQQLAEQEYARSEFLATVSHELRTPLTAASGFLQIIRQGGLRGDALYSALDTVGRNVQEIVSLVNDILFLQEMDLIPPEFLSTNIGVLVEGVINDYRARAEQGNVRLWLNLGARLPDVFVDPRSLGRAITAVVDNAIKFSPAGGDVQVEVAHDGSQLWIKVADHGVGIPPEALPHIFNRFFRLDQVGGYLFRGLGLGLSVAQQVVKRHGGEITAESELGKGSTFTIWLPIRVKPSQ